MQGNGASAGQITEAMSKMKDQHNQNHSAHGEVSVETLLNKFAEQGKKVKILTEEEEVEQRQKEAEKEALVQ